MTKPEEPVEYKSHRDYEDKVIFLEGENQHVPKYSEWKRVCSCCCGHCNLIYFPAIKQYFCNQWECRPTYPFFVTFGYCITLAFALLSVIELISGWRRIVLLAVTSATFVLWLISYYCAVCRSPGYLPFYWAVERRESFTFEEQMDGVVTTEEQFNFAAYNARPERGAFSKQARRLILKADHICKWIANWVGLKNYRWFFLKLIWGTIYFICWFADLIVCAIEMRNGWVNKVGFIGMIVLFLPVFGFFGFLIVMIRRHTVYTCRNTGTLQQFRVRKKRNKHNYYDLGCRRNCVSVFGPGSCCLCWFFPVPISRKWGGFHWETNGTIPPSTEEDSDTAEEPEPQQQSEQEPPREEV